MNNVMSSGVNGMRYTVSISGVDGETECTIENSRAQYALEFMRQQDHEGSSIALVVFTDHPEAVYEVLRRCRDMEADLALNSPNRHQRFVVKEGEIELVPVDLSVVEASLVQETHRPDNGD